MPDILHTGPAFTIELYLTIEIDAKDEQEAYARAQQIAARHRPLRPRKPSVLPWLRDKEYHVQVSDVFETRYEDDDGEPI